jgi:hypothetical protein
MFCKSEHQLPALSYISFGLKYKLVNRGVYDYEYFLPGSAQIRHLQETGETRAGRTVAKRDPRTREQTERLRLRRQMRLPEVLLPTEKIIPIY